MPSDNDLVFMLNRLKAAIEENIKHAVAMMQLKQSVDQLQTTIAGLNSQVEQKKKLVEDIGQFDQLKRQRAAELAALDAQIAAKHEEHGRITATIQGLRTQLTKNLENVSA
jgi:hypothetical protein